MAGRPSGFREEEVGRVHRRESGRLQKAPPNSIMNHDGTYSNLGLIGPGFGRCPTAETHPFSIPASSILL